MNKFRKFRKYLLIGLTTLSLGTATCGALAEEDPDGGPMPSGGGPCGAHGGKFAEHVAKRLTELHDQLKLTTEDQERAWKTFVEQMKPTPPTRPNWSEWSTLSAPARLEKEVALMQAHQDHLAKQVLPAVQTFYAVLNSEQKTIFNEQFGWHRHHGGPPPW